MPGPPPGMADLLSLLCFQGLGPPWLFPPSSTPHPHLEAPRVPSASLEASFLPGNCFFLQVVNPKKKMKKKKYVNSGTVSSQASPVPLGRH